MGCHTWCYKKVDITIEEAREIWIKNAKKHIERWTEITNDPNHEMRQEDAYPEWDQEYCENHLRISKEQLERVENGIGDKKVETMVMRQQPELSIYLGKGKFYIEEGTHDPFRIYGYPTDRLYSYEETLAYIKKYEKEKSVKVELYNDGKTLKKFWENNPDGLIEFG